VPRKADVAQAHDPRDGRQLLRDEFAQRSDSGFDVPPMAKCVARAHAGREDPTSWLDRLEASERRSDWLYDEATDLPHILAALDADTGERAAIDEADLAVRLRRAWLGRCAGCLVGKPVEGWSRREIARYLTLAGGVLGALRGDEGVAPILAQPLHDLVRSAISGFDGTSISALAARTLRLAGSYRRTPVAEAIR
jgi:hypothetical protein